MSVSVQPIQKTLSLFGFLGVLSVTLLWFEAFHQTAGFIALTFMFISGLPLIAHILPQFRSAFRGLCEPKPRTLDSTLLPTLNRWDLPQQIKNQTIKALEDLQEFVIGRFENNQLTFYPQAHHEGTYLAARRTHTQPLVAIKKKHKSLIRFYPILTH